MNVNKYNCSTLNCSNDILQRPLCTFVNLWCMEMCHSVGCFHQIITTICITKYHSAFFIFIIVYLVYITVARLFRLALVVEHLYIYFNFTTESLCFLDHNLCIYIYTNVTEYFYREKCANNKKVWVPHRIFDHGSEL